MGKAVGLTGPLARDALMTKTQKYVKDFLLEKAQSLITSAVSDAIKGKKASDPPKPMDELCATSSRAWPPTSCSRCSPSS